MAILDESLGKQLVSIDVESLFQLIYETSYSLVTSGTYTHRFFPNSLDGIQVDTQKIQEILSISGEQEKTIALIDYSLSKGYSDGKSFLEGLPSQDELLDHFEDILNKLTDNYGIYAQKIRAASDITEIKKEIEDIDAELQECWTYNGTLANTKQNSKEVNSKLTRIYYYACTELIHSLRSEVDRKETNIAEEELTVNK